MNGGAVKHQLLANDLMQNLAKRGGGRDIPYMETRSSLRATSVVYAKSEVMVPVAGARCVVSEV